MNLRACDSPSRPNFAMRSRRAFAPALSGFAPALCGVAVVAAAPDAGGVVAAGLALGFAASGFAVLGAAALAGAADASTSASAIDVIGTARAA